MNQLCFYALIASARQGGDDAVEFVFQQSGVNVCRRPCGLLRQYIGMNGVVTHGVQQPVFRCRRGNRIGLRRLLSDIKVV